MSSFLKAIVLGMLLSGAVAHAQTASYPGIGRAATAKELTAWDIDVRPDFKGLPKGKGSVAKGMDIWEGKCASCHGVFGESNQVFSPITGGNTKEDMQTGRVARLNDAGFPGRTTMMKLSQLSTLWDYINRAMPWNAPKSLTSDEVYAVTAYVLNLGGVLPDDFTLSDQNMAQVQAMLPNRNGMTTEHAMWPGSGFGKRAPDVKAVACMKDCPVSLEVASSLPDFARNAHGNLAEQNRLVGAQVGADTTVPPGAAKPAAATPQAVPAAATAAPVVAAVAPAPSAAKPVAAKPGADSAATIALTQKYACNACHGMDNKILGPSFRDIAKKYGTRADAPDYLAGKIKAGGSGVWGAIPMPAQGLPAAEAKQIAQWLSEGAKK
jgi:cytochrome c